MKDNTGAAIEKLAEYYQLDQAQTQTMSPSQILETYGQDVYDLLYSMENGQYSTVVETQYGYHVFQMIALTDQTKTNEQKIVLYNQQVQEALSDTLTKWQAQIDPIFKYPDSWDKIKMHRGCILGETKENRHNEKYVAILFVVFFIVKKENTYDNSNL